MNMTLYGGRNNHDLTRMVPPFVLALLLYVVFAEVGYQIRPLTVDNGRICLLWLPFAVSVLLCRVYSTPALFGVASGAFLVGSASPLTAPITAFAAALTNALQVKSTLAALRDYESRREECLRHGLLLLWRILVVTAAAALITLTISAFESQRMWGDVWTGAFYWVAGDIITAALLWIGLRRFGIDLSIFSEPRPLSAREQTERVVGLASSACRFLLQPIWKSKTATIHGCWQWMEDWIRDQRALGRPERAIRLEAVEHLATEVASSIPTCVGMISANLRDRCRRSLSAVARITVRVLYWIFIDYPRH